MKFHIPPQSKLLEKAHFVTSSLLPELFLSQSYRNLILFTSLDLQYPSLPLLSRITLVALSAACCCSPEWHQLLRAAQGQSPPATKLPVSAAEQTVGPVNFTLQLLGEVFQLLICITWSCCPRNVIFQIQAKKKKKENCFCKNFVLLAIPFPPPPITEKA